MLNGLDPCRFCGEQPQYYRGLTCGRKPCVLKALEEMPGSMSLPPKLTTAQLRYVERLRSEPEKKFTFNCRAERLLNTLHAHGLIELTCDLIPDSKHGLALWWYAKARAQPSAATT